MTDWYWTHNAEKRGFQARAVVGGVFIRLLDNPNVWQKWVSRADSVSGRWLPIPRPPKIIEVVPTSLNSPRQWYYTFEKPADGWSETGFDPARAGWKQGPGGFGAPDTPGTAVRTTWNTSYIWLTRTFLLENVPHDLLLMLHHDEDAEIYINGVPAARYSGYTTGCQRRPLSKTAQAALKKGANTISMHCHQTMGDRYIDAGLVRVVEQD